MKRLFAILAVAMLVSIPVHSRTTTERVATQLAELMTSEASTVAPSSGSVEVGFSPNKGALELVLKAINSARVSIDLMAYSFTSADVTRALLSAIHRGVRVRVLVDHDQNFKDKSAKPIAALSSITNAGGTVKTISAYAIFHDKTMLLDKRHLQTGSFNYSQSAATRNSENVIVLWNAPEVARVYQTHFDKNWDLGAPFRGR